MLKKAVLILLIGSLLGLAVLSPSQSIRSAGETQETPPSVIDVWPEPGVELLPGDSLTVSFDQPMDKPSVESSLRLSPAVVGTFNWDDAQTLSFKPKDGWPREQTYKLTIQAPAAAATGLAFATPFTAQLKTLGPLTVASVSPQPNAEEAATNSRLVISFNRPVVALTAASDTNKSAPLPLEIEPNIKGKGEWVNTSLFTFTPSAPLAINTRYTVRIPARITSADGSVLAQAYEWSFYTVPPGVVGVDFRPSSPEYYSDQTRVSLNSGVNVKFSQSMDKASTEAAFALKSGDEAVSGKFFWSDNNKTLLFQPTTLLKVDSDYKVTVGSEAKAAGNVGALRKARTFTFHTQPYPKLVSTDPKEGQARFNSYWPTILTYNVPMSAKSFKDKVQVSPNVSDLEISSSYSGAVSPQIYIHFSSSPNTQYTVTIQRGVTDTFGNAITNDFTLTFTTSKKIGAPQPAQPTVFEPVINGDLMITNANRSTMGFDMTYFESDPIPVNVSLYHMTPAEVGAIRFENHQWWYINNYQQWGGNYDNLAYYTGAACATPDAVQPKNLIKSFKYEPSKTGNNTPNVSLTDQSGGKLAVGMYWITLGETRTCYASGSDRSERAEIAEGPERQFGLAVVNANITIKRGSEDAFIWVTDLDTAAPIANASVTLYIDGKVYTSGKTDAQGAVRLPVRILEQRYFMVTAEAPGVFGTWYNFWHNGARILRGEPYAEDEQNEYISDPTTSVGNIYTDRPIYRPGDTIYFRGIMRDKRDLSYPVPQNRTVYVTIGEAEVYYYGYTYYKGDSKLYEGKLTLTEYGTFSGEFTIPKDAKARWVYIQVGKQPQATSEYSYIDMGEDAVISAAISAYRAAEFQVNGQADQTSIFQGDKASAIFVGQYFSGTPLSEANVEWKVSATNGAFDYQGKERYDFSDYDYYDYYGRQRAELDSGTATADKKGQISVQTTRTKPPENAYWPVMQITLNAVYNEGNGTQVTGRTSLLAYASNLFIGLKARTDFRAVDVPFTFNVLAVDKDSQPRANQELSVSVNGTFVERIKTDASGKAEFTFTPRERGSYSIQFTGIDELGRTSVRSTSVYIWSQGDQRNVPDNALNITVSRESTRPGEDVEVTIEGPFKAPGRLLITTERAGVLTYAVIDPKGQNKVNYTLKTLDSFAPNVYLTATYLPGLNGSSAKPNILYAGTALDVELVKPLLNLEITPSKRQAKPSESVTFNIRVTDSEGKPVVGEVGLALVDKAVLALLPPNDTPLRTTFYSPQEKRVFTDFSVDGLIEALFTRTKPEAPGRGGGGAGGSDAESPDDVRQNFKVTPLWAPHVVTDQDGRASVTLQMPDNLTAWRLDARIVTKNADIQIAQTQTEITTSLPLSIRPTAPRFFVVGDQVQLAATVLNGTKTPQAVKVRLDAKGLTLNSAATQTISIPAESRGRVVWSAVVERGTGVDLTYSAEGQDGARDAAKPSLTTGPNNTIPILNFTTPDVPAATAGILREGGSLSEIVSIPRRLKDYDGVLSVRVEPSLAATLPDSLNFLQQYPYYCIEQTASTFLPNIFTYRALHDLGKSDPSLEKGLGDNMKAALEKIASAQNEDGGWGWYKGWDSHALITTYVVLALTEAKNAGLNIGPKLDQTNIDRGIAYMKSHLGDAGTSTRWWVLNRRAFIYYVLGRAGKPDVKALEALFEARTEMSYAGRAYLLLAFLESDPKHAAIKTLTDDLISAAKLTATGVFWEESDWDWWNWGSNIRTTALAISALLRTAPDNPLLPNAIRWLMTARQGDHWSSTQETVWSLNALVGWMLKTGELDSKYDYSVLLNRDTLAKAAVSPDTVRANTLLNIPVRDLASGKANRLTFTRGDGKGALYYTAKLQLQIPAQNATAASKGFSVKREYFLGADRYQRINSARVGDMVTVRLTLTVSQAVQFFVLQDTLPAGLEPVDKALLTESDSASDYDPYYDEYWYWGWWYLRERELRDTGAVLSADELPAGTYVYTYQAKAVTAGVFQVIPAYASTFYNDSLFGRSNGQLFEILPAK